MSGGGGTGRGSGTAGRVELARAASLYKVERLILKVFDLTFFGTQVTTNYLPQYDMLLEILV